MADYLISKAAVQKMLIDLREHLNEHYISIGISMALQKMEGFKPADAVEVVRCRDCKHAIVNENHIEKPLICCLTKMVGTTDPDWFCAAGERKEGGAEV